MAEPLTKAEMVAGYKAARARMEAAGLPEKPHMDSVYGLKIQASVALWKKHEKARRDRQLQRAEQLLSTALAERYSVQSILALVAHVHGMSVGDVKGPRRARPYIHARFHAVHLLSTLRPDLSLPAIGRALGGRDHTAVMNARAKWPTLQEICARQIAEVERLMAGKSDA